jgi:uncharacterized protein YecT (DUF1311 family)
VGAGATKTIQQRAPIEDEICSADEYSAQLRCLQGAQSSNAHCADQTNLAHRVWGSFWGVMSDSSLLPAADMKIIQRMRIFLLLLRPVALCVSVAITAGSFAQNATPTNQTDQDCRLAIVGSTMRTCENARYDIAQRELNSVYQNLLRGLDETQRERLRQAQRAWLRFRDTNAEFQASLVQGGTSAPLIKVGSLTEMTNERASELKKVLITERSPPKRQLRR